MVCGAFAPHIIFFIQIYIINVEWERICVWKGRDNMIGVVIIQIPNDQTIICE